MARTKYKLGTFVKVAETEDTNVHYGAVEEIRLTTDGTAYKLTGLEETVTEDQIEQGYRPIATRKVTARTTAKKTRKTRETQAQASA